jgi:hypothetical protein
MLVDVEIQVLKIDLMHGVAMDDPILSLDRDCIFIRTKLVEYLSLSPALSSSCMNKENADNSSVIENSENSNSLKQLFKISEKSRKSVTFNPVDQVAQMPSW